MDAKARWQALQAQLARAQERLSAGDRAGALEAVDAALTIDPNFLAAHALRDRIITEVGVISVPSERAPAPDAVRPLVSPEGYAQFEQRARRRRVDRRVDAARAAIAEGRRNDAVSALDEIRELDPQLPELLELTAAFAGMPAAKAPSRAPAGRWLAAAAAFGAIVLGASWLEESGALGSRSLVAIAPLVAPPHPLAVTVSAAEPEFTAPDLVAGTTGDSVPLPPDMPAPARAITSVGTVTPASVAPPSVPLAAPPAVVPAANPAPNAVPATIPAAEASSPAPAPVALPPPAPPIVTAAFNAAPAPTSPAVPAVAVPDDETLVQQTLQRYRKAYEGLDARSARAVWPAVNESALARAFDGLASQSLTFDACDVTLRGEGAAAVCRGTTRYVPKVGSREPRVEPRTWNFTLKRAGTSWEIETARAER